MRIAGYAKQATGEKYLDHAERLTRHGTISVRILVARATKIRTKISCPAQLPKSQQSPCS